MEKTNLQIYNAANHNAAKLITCFKSGLCPKCQTGSSKNIVSGFYSNNKSGLQISLIRVCHECGELYFQTYKLPKNFIEHNRSIDLTKFSPTTYPNNQIPCEFSKEIETISPRFCEIYNQAYIAETNDCTEVCGMGYRKSLEFLIKDYLISNNPKQAELISKELLSATIKRIDNIKIKTLAERCNWLGNDECHYIRKHQEYNVNDLKLFIRALITYIESELIFKKAMGVDYKK